MNKWLLLIGLLLSNYAVAESYDTCTDRCDNNLNTCEARCGQNVVCLKKCQDVKTTCYTAYGKKEKQKPWGELDEPSVNFSSSATDGERQ
jgi:hypothetical protein